MRNKAISARHVMANLPHSYAQAAAVVAQLIRIAKESGYAARLVGHSKGRGEAIYAGLSQPEPMQVDVFSPAHLRPGLLQTVPAANLQRGSDGLVRSYTVEGDFILGLRKFASPLGAQFVFPPTTFSAPGG